MGKRKLHDEYFNKAKREGYVARSAYKLLEIHQKRRIIRPGDRVLDLGCAPGSWVQVASELVGDSGVVVGVDLQPVRLAGVPNARTSIGDVFEMQPEELLALQGPDPKRYNAVISDMAPSTAGGAGGSIDHFRSVDLCRRVLALVPDVLRPGGNAVMKVLEGEAYKDLLDETAGLFSTVRGFKPKSSRDVSREMFVVATGYEPALAGAREGAAG